MPWRFLSALQRYIPHGDVSAGGSYEPHACAQPPSAVPVASCAAPLVPNMPRELPDHPQLAPWHPLLAPAVAWPAAPPPPPPPAADEDDASMELEPQSPAAALAAEAMLTLLDGGGASSGGPGPCCCCGTRESPMWRKHPATRAPLCNACGLRIMRGKPPLPVGAPPAPRRTAIAPPPQAAKAAATAVHSVDGAAPVTAEKRAVRPNRRFYDML